MTKLCKTCQQEKPEADFHRDRSKADGLNAYCKACHIAKQREYASKPPRRKDPEGFKTCNRCKELKPVGDYYAKAATWDGLDKRCKTCSAKLHTDWRLKNLDKMADASRRWRTENPERSRDHSLKHNYGIEIGTYDRMFAAQGGQCAICKTRSTGRHARFHVDHCHDTGKVRGLLCHGCNVSLGHFKHDVEVLQAAIIYLAETKTPPG